MLSKPILETVVGCPLSCLDLFEPMAPKSRAESVVAYQPTEAEMEEAKNMLSGLSAEARRSKMQSMANYMNKTKEEIPEHKEALKEPRGAGRDKLFC